MCIRDRGELVQKRGEGGAALLRLGLPDHLTRAIVERPEDRAALVGAGRHLHRTAPSLPDLCQVGTSVEGTFIHVDKPESRFGKRPLFWSSARTCLAEATASASCRWVRSWRGRR